MPSLLALYQNGHLRDAAAPLCALSLLAAAAGCGGESGNAQPGLSADNLTTGGEQSGDASDGNAPSTPTLVEEQFTAARVSATDAPSNTDTNGGAWRLIEVPAASNAPVVTHSPSGWLALSRRSVGDARAPSGWQNVLYRSTDGVHWVSLPLGPQDDYLQLFGLAYGAGRYVIAGRRLGGAFIWASTDAEAWIETAQPVSDTNIWGPVAYAQNRFFGFGFRYLGISETGADWKVVHTTLVQTAAAAYGNGHYLLVGSGPMVTSDDSWTWQEHQLDCALPSACITDPSGGVHQGFHSNAFFADGHFYSGELTSTDGANWQTLPGRSPSAYASGHFLGSPSLSAGVATWVSGGEIETLRLVRPSRTAVTAAGRAMTSVGVLDRQSPLPDSVNVEFEDGLTCENADCVLVDGRLLLIPPPGTPPLPDRVPRTANGQPLLSDQCPHSSMIFCSDYAGREDCTCHPDAPAAPNYCEDVSQYRCAGQFTPRADEWQVDEVAQAGCSCDAVDPNQPAGFGSACGDGSSSTCQLPLACLPIEPVPSAGPPLPRSMCTSACSVDADCPSWQATGFCDGPVHLRCAGGSCQPRACD